MFDKAVRTVPLEQVEDFIRALGLEPSQVAQMTLEPRDIRVLVYLPNENGQPHLIDQRAIAAGHLTIPIVGR